MGYLWWLINIQCKDAVRARSRLCWKGIVMNIFWAAGRNIWLAPRFCWNFINSAHCISNAEHAGALGHTLTKLSTAAARAILS